MPNPINAVPLLDVEDKYREKLGVLENEKICLSIGNFLPTKNHKYMIDIFIKLKNKTPKVKLLLAGDGELKSEIECLIKQNDLDNIIILGYRNDIQKLLNIADVVIMPSLFEGIPVSAIETQSLGIPLILSNNISSELKINTNVESLPIDDKSVELWANEILRFAMSTKVSNKNFINSKYNIKNSIVELENYYIELIRGIE